MTYEVREVVAEDRDALVALFEREHCPCYCRYWHFAGTNKEWEARCGLEPEANRDELSRALAEGSEQARGLVARDPDGAIVGWMKLAPRPLLAKLLARPPYRGLGAPAEVLSIGCFLVDAAHRRKGVARALVEGAIRIAPRRGARFLEAYPRVADAMHDFEQWTGPYSLFASLGFEVVPPDEATGYESSTPYPVLRRPVGSV